MVWVVGVVALLISHLIVWTFLALRVSGDSAPTRWCPCPFAATPWTFAFWAPEAVLLGGLVLALLARRYAGPVAITSVAVGFIALGVVAALYGEDIKRMWSLP